WAGTSRVPSGRDSDLEEPAVALHVDKPYAGIVLDRPADSVRQFGSFGRAAETRPCSRCRDAPVLALEMLAVRSARRLPTSGRAVDRQRAEPLTEPAAAAGADPRRAASPLRCSLAPQSTAQLLLAPRM